MVLVCLEKAIDLDGTVPKYYYKMLELNDFGPERVRAIPQQVVEWYDGLLDYCQDSMSEDEYEEVEKERAEYWDKYMDDEDPRRATPMETLYEDLGVARDATQGDIKKAYHKHVLRSHPGENSERDRGKEGGVDE